MVQVLGAFVVVASLLSGSVAMADEKVSQNGASNSAITETSYPAQACVRALEWLREHIAATDKSKGGHDLDNQFIASADMIATIDPQTKQPVILTKQGVLHPDGTKCKSGTSYNVDDFVAEHIKAEVNFTKVDVVNCKAPAGHMEGTSGKKPRSEYTCFEGWFNGDCRKLGGKTAAAIDNVMKAKKK